MGAEALDEVVGGLKVQLAPKTNFWSNTAGAMNVAKTVADMLKPTPKVTILEIGCGIGVIGLTMASVSTRVTYTRHVYKQTFIIMSEMTQLTSYPNFVCYVCVRICAHTNATLNE